MFHNNITILDGGLGTTLQEKGMNINGDPLWTARLLHSDQEAIFDVHKEFLNFGAQILTTACYQASIEGYRKNLNLGTEESLNLIKQSVVISKKARDLNKNSSILIAGSVGPYGACQADYSEYHGLYINSMTEEFVMNWHKPRIDALNEAGVDLIAVETIPSLKEALAIIKLLKKYPIKYWLSFSCKDETHTNYGDDFGQSFKKVFEAGGSQVVAIGINCTNVKYITFLLKMAAKHTPITDIPRIVYPNLCDSTEENRLDNDAILLDLKNNLLKEWIGLGATVIGGCCYVCPQMIGKISDTIVQRKYL